MTSPQMVEGTVLPLVRALAAAGHCQMAGHVIDKLRWDGGRMNSKQAVQVVTSIAMQSVRADALQLVSQLHAVLASQDLGVNGAGERYFRHFSELLIRDFLAEVAAGLQGSQRQSVTGMQCMGQKASAWEFRGQVPKSSTLQKGDAVLASFGDSPPIEGTLSDVWHSGLCLKVSLANAMAFAPSGVMWRIDKVANKVVLDRQLNALRSVCMDPDFLASEPGRTHNPDRAVGRQLRDVVLTEAVSGPLGGPCYALAPEAALCASQPSWSSGGIGQAYLRNPFLSRLNQSQREAISAASNRLVTLVQGPPGTGKTHTAVGLIAQWVQIGVRPVLAVADSNQGADNIMMGLQKAGINAVRLGQNLPDKSQADFDFFSGGYTSTAPKGSSKGSMSTKDVDALFAQQKRMIKSSDAVVSTCAGAGSDQLEKMGFPAVLVDEASQATEPSVLIPFAKGAKVCALVGDHEQLPPTVLCEEAKELGLGRSLFDRMVARGVEPLLLDTQYRMHPALAAFPSEATYGGRIQSGVSKALRLAPQGFNWPLKGVPIAFVDVSGFEQQVGSSFCNPAEAQKVAEVLRQLLSGGLKAADIGVITPYQEQVKLLSRCLPAGIEVSSVDGFQGREKEVICVSTVRANASGSIGFLKDRRRTNVTITRARRGLVVCGHASTLAHDTGGLWGKWLHWARERGLISGCSASDPALMAALSELDGGQHIPDSGTKRPWENGAGPAFQVRAVAPRWQGW
eukprot:TRINITY_DN48398_c0_g1_i1.p1 TRINITY_DN48398_c0_g1~~TRINITY_DN48398_c0_g1_i1.p1  ORF type:complete len:858 (-),score=157.50 TRINITY_DN48398_c0_g1_i1:43-2256(-)